MTFAQDVQPAASASIDANQVDQLEQQSAHDSFFQGLQLYMEKNMRVMRDSKYDDSLALDTGSCVMTIWNKMIVK